MELIMSFGKSIILGLILGIVLGFFLKEFIKIIIIVAILAIVAVYFGISKGWIDPAWFSFITVPEFSLPKSWNIAPAVSLLFNHIPFAIGAIVGFYIDFKKG